MNDNFSAMLVCGGKKRLIPVEKGIAYAVLNEFESDKPLAIGHPFTAENKNLLISVAADSGYSKWCAEIHNPTDKPVSTVLKSNPDLTGAETSETVTLAPGGILVREFK